MQRNVVRFTPSCREDFFRLHSDANDAGWCHCVAWWMPTWAGWGDRTAEENRRLREELLDRGEFDGYLLYADGLPVGWCQVGPRDRLDKLVRQFRLIPDPETWAISCIMVAPAWRGQGLAAHLVAQVLRDLRERGARRVEAYPKRGEGLDAGDVWTGPEALWRAAGFQVVRDDPRRPILAIEW